jgi:Multicopper oxidase
MYHCHIIEHHAAGMMASFEVIDPADPSPSGKGMLTACHS